LATLAMCALAACATATRYSASSDIHDFLVAVRDDDQAAFDAHIDRPALKANLKARLLAAAADRYGVASPNTLGALALAGPVANLAVDSLARPEVFQAAAALLGYGPETRVPNFLVIGQVVRPLDSQRVCVEAKRRCTFIFREEDGRWKLVAFDGDLGLLSRRARP
jgi:hypothetical protein